MRILLFVAACASGLILATSGAGAAETKPVAVKRNTTTQIGSYVSYFESSCRATDQSDSRISEQPANGVATLAFGSIQMPKGHRCEGFNVRGAIISYRPRPGFVGRDKVVFSRSISRYEEQPPVFDEIVYDITVQ